MKKIAILIALVIVPMVTSAQSFFDTLEDMDGVDTVSYTHLTLPTTPYV